MRIAALGDIHSNHYALKACLEWIYKNNIDGIAFLGDYVSDFPYPQKTLEILRNIPKKYTAWFIKGNREEYMINHYNNHNDGWCYNSQSGSLLYTYDNLTEDDINCFKEMPISMDIDIIKDVSFTICHGSPDTTRQLIFPDTREADELIDRMENNLLICGHCHHSYIYTKNGKTIANGGSVGLPCNGQINSQFIVAEYKNDNWKVEIVSIPYDIDKATKEFYDSGLIDKANIWAKTMMDTIRTGHYYNDECIKIVKSLSKERNLLFSDESLWVEAYNSLNIKI